MEQSRRAVAGLTDISFNSRTDPERFFGPNKLCRLIFNTDDQAGYHRSIVLGRPGFPRPFQSLKALRCLFHSLGLAFNIPRWYPA